MRVLWLSAFLFHSWFSLAHPATVPLSQSGVTGTVKRHENFNSKYVDPRHVDVWLPPGYEQNSAARFPVIYMHDGQNLFDPKTSYTGIDWGVDETLTRLIAAGKTRAAIVVGVWNTPKRALEYMPQQAATGAGVRFLKDAPELPREQIISDNYLKFLVEELKPFIDATYRTLPGRADTFIMGSSMGGLISAYAMSQYPEVFGGAGCLSTHWVAGDGAVIAYLKQHLPDARTHKFYFDYGTETLDASYEPYQQKMDAVMRQAGYHAGKNWVTRKFVGAEHAEKAWRARVDIPLTFLLGKEK